MTTYYKTKAIVFKKSDINETDRFFHVFTENFGRLNIFAKAIRKTVSKLRSGMDVFFMSELEFIQGKSKKTLTDTALIKKFNNICKDPVRFKIACAMGEVLDSLLRGEEKDVKIFNLINETLLKINEGNIKNKNFYFIYYYFLWNFLSLLGYCPEVNNCSSCEEKLNPYNVYFLNKAGGIVCEKCSQKDSSSVKINSDIVKVLRLVLKKDWQTIAKIKIEDPSEKLFQKISNNYYSYILSKTT